MRIVTYGLEERVEKSENMMIGRLNDSDASVLSWIGVEWGERSALRW